MKLRQHKHDHIKRLRRRIACRTLKLEWDRASDDVADAIAKAIMAPGEAIKQRLLLIFNPAGDLVAHAIT